MTKFHPEHDMLVEYVAGSLPWHLSIAVSVHVAMCSDCKKQVNQIQQLAGNLFAESKGLAIGSDVLEGALARLDETPVEKPEPVAADSASPLTIGGIQMPKSLSKLIKGKVEALDWKSVTQNLDVAELETVTDQYKISLHRIAAGGVIPKHTHVGNEVTVVLEGGFSDSMGAYNAGDFVHRTGEHEHSPRAAENEDCLCLTIVENPVKLTGFFGRMLNPFIR